MMMRYQLFNIIDDIIIYFEKLYIYFSTPNKDSVILEREPSESVDLKNKMNFQDLIKVNLDNTWY